MNTKSSATALKLLNLYRQEHVIIGGWAAVNQVFVAQANDDVIRELKNMPTGKSLVQHIENLRSGKTPMDSIERDLMPYGGMMLDSTVPSIKLDDNQWQELEYGIDNFTPDQAGLETFTALGVVQKFGTEWITAIADAINQKPYLRDKWNIITQTYNAYRLWNTANEIIATPISERVRGQVQADMPEYETYLPMFGDAGMQLLEKLRTIISSLK
ncbi:MAG: hypothetical protein IKJ62_04895 [Alphaproteobacteria bacterium]|nr:hypothetical protein [Alphaproteobacteria bacterium]